MVSLAARREKLQVPPDLNDSLQAFLEERTVQRNDDEPQRAWSSASVTAGHDITFQAHPYEQYRLGVDDVDDDEEEEVEEQETSDEDLEMDEDESEAEEENAIETVSLEHVKGMLQSINMNFVSHVIISWLLQSCMQE